MTTSTSFEKIGDIFKCELTLPSNEKFIIPMREDGYIFATGLCKVSGKRLTKWRENKETKELIKTLENKSEFGVSALIEIYKGGNDKYSQGTWVHPDLGMHLAQWCNPSFSSQVSKWIRELLIVGKVEIGKEKSSEELKELYEQKIKEMNENFERQLEEKTKIIMTETEKNLILSRKYDRVMTNHQTFLRKKELYRLKRGGCVYLVIMTEEDKDKKTKVGLSRDITDSISGYRTANPFCKLLFVMYTEDYTLMETNIKRRFQDELYPNNREFITGVTTEKLIDSIKNIADMLSIKYTLETEDQLDIFNKHNIKIIGGGVKEDEPEEPLPEITKRCGGLTHMTEESRFLPLSNFFKNSGNEDGVNRICKDCHLVGVYGDKRKIRKIVKIPEYDEVTQKWCNRCEKVHSRENFFKSKDTKDGLYANCKNCKNEQKKASRNKEKNKSTELSVA
jgi:hypothetical protein